MNENQNRERDVRISGVSLIRLYQPALLNWLRETGAKTPAEIEDFIRIQFQAKWTERDRKINGNGIFQWRNDVHWARAHLTHQGLIVTNAGKILAVEEGAIRPRAKKSKPAGAKRKAEETKPALLTEMDSEILPSRSPEAEITIKQEPPHEPLSPAENGIISPNHAGEVCGSDQGLG